MGKTYLGLGLEKGERSEAFCWAEGGTEGGREGGREEWLTQSGISHPAGAASGQTKQKWFVSSER